VGLTGRRIGVLGAGWGTRVSVPAFRAAGWDVVGLWSRRPERAQAEAARLDIPLATIDADALITRPDVDAVAIHTPPATHLALCRAAFEAGKHVLCDKPFAMTAAEAREICRAAEASGLVAMINFEFRFAPLRLQIKQLLDEGVIGTFRHASFEVQINNPLIQLGRPWRLDPAEGGGVLNELGSHGIDRFRQWFGDLSSVSAELASFPPPTDTGLATEDWLRVTCTFEDGGLATLVLSWVADPPQGLHGVIVGAEGVLTARAAGSMLTDGEIALGRREEEALAPVPSPADQRDFDTANGSVAASRRLIDAFDRGIGAGVSPAPNFRDALHSQIAIDAIRESAASGRTVHLANEPTADSS